MPRAKKQLPRRCGGMPVYEAITDMARRGLREIDIARALGVGYHVWTRIKEENSKALDAFEEGRCVEHASLVGMLHEQALTEKNPSAAMFLLKTRYGYREKDQVTQSESRIKIMFELPGSASPEAYQKVIEGEVLKKEQKKQKRGKG